MYEVGFQNPLSRDLLDIIKAKDNKASCPQIYTSQPDGRKIIQAIQICSPYELFMCRIQLLLLKDRVAGPELRPFETVSDSAD